MLSFEASVYVLECERRFALQAFERGRQRGLTSEVPNNAPDHQSLLRIAVRSLGGLFKLPPTTATSPTASDIHTATLERRICSTRRRHRAVVCAGCGAAIRASKPACSPAQRRARKQRRPVESRGGTTAVG